MTKYFTIVIRADNEVEARHLTPGQKIGLNEIVGVSLGDVLTLNDQLRELVSEENQAKADKVETDNIMAFLTHSDRPGK